MTLWTLDIVEVGVIPRLPLAIYLPNADPAVTLDVPCYCYLLTRPGHATLIDSGPDRDASAAAGFTIAGDPRAALQHALQRRGLVPDDVREIIHTHLHYDHMQNDVLFPRSRVIVREQELGWIQSGLQDRFYVGMDLYLETVGDRLESLEGEREVIAGITLLPNGGHTPGHQSILVATVEGPVCLCADIVPMATNVEIPAPSQDPAATQAFLIRLAQSAWEVLPGHDPTLRQHRWFVGSRE
jgi:glyoxylase-like metal-dependent hydrolase (beta-lactamase superfamily II)